MNAASAGAQAPAAAAPREPARVDRLLAAVPVAFVFVALLTLYFVEAWMRKTPWLFTDEIEWTQISRAIAQTGHAARRGQPIYFKSLYAFLLAPFWWIHSTAAAYAAIKYMNAFVMTLAAVPTYLLARMLVPRRTAAVVAFLAVAVPAMTYAASIVPEVLAYPWYALCSWLVVRALATRKPLAVALAVAASIAAVLVRTQLGTISVSFALAAAALWVTGPHGRRLRARWSRGDTLGAIVLLAGAVVLFNHVVLQHVSEWHVTTEYWKGRMIGLGLEAALAFAVGIGILPVIGGFASLRLRERRGDPAYRGFAAYLAASIVCVALYTSVKAAFLSTNFATLTEERNLIYLAPLLLVGTAMVFHARRIDWLVVGGATAFVLVLILLRRPDVVDYPNFEAPGYGILDTLNRNLRWNVDDLRIAMLVALALMLAALRFRRVRAVAAAVAVLGAAWTLTAEISTTHGEVNLSQRFRTNLPTPLDWIDRDVHGRPVSYLGQEIVDPNGIWETEFWNRSIEHVGSLSGDAPGPGPTFAPNIVSADGLLTELGDVPYVVADNGVTLQAKIVDRWNQLVLYERTGPWRLRDSEQQVYSDGWMPGWASYTYYAPGQHGTLVLNIGRTGYNGSAPAGVALLKAGTVKVVNEQAQLGHVYYEHRVLVRNDTGGVVKIPVRRTPVRLEIFIKHTIPPQPYDPRNLGAQVSFRFVPAK